MQTRYLNYDLCGDKNPYNIINEILTNFMVMGIEAKLYELTSTYAVFEVKLDIKQIELTDYLNKLSLTDDELNDLVDDGILLRFKNAESSISYYLNPTNTNSLGSLRDKILSTNKITTVNSQSNIRIRL